MIKHRLLLLSLAVPLLLAACHQATSAERDAIPIVERNAEARGGLPAWRAVKSMSMSGRLDAGRARDPARQAANYRRPLKEVKAAARQAVRHGAEADEGRVVRLPFVMELKRPRKTRLEIKFQGDAAVQVYDGGKGWKVRPFLGRKEVEPFTVTELQLASQQAELDGPLMDCAAKGSTVELLGVEKVEGRDAYKIRVTSSGGLVRHVWVDTQTYLDVKIDGTRQMDGKPRTIWTTFRDYRSVSGLMIPHVLETTTEDVRGSETIVVDHVELNGPVDDARFARPG